MKKATVFTSIALVLLGFKPNLNAQKGFIPPASDSLILEILHYDSLLFDAVFENCDADKLKEYVAADLEFYHDKWGQIADSGEVFVEAIRGNCERQQLGTDNKAKRELLKETVEIYPLNNFGAIQMGTHWFYQLKNGEFVFTESGKFTHVWKKMGDKWVVSRILSYDHREGE